MPNGPYLLTPEAHDAIVKAIEAGAPRETAAGAANVARSTMHGWLKKGKQERRSGVTDTPHARLSEAVELAEGRAVTLALEQMRKLALARKDWQAFAWWLERRHPEHFGRDTRMIRELQKQVAQLQKVIVGLLPPSSSPSPPPLSGALDVTFLSCLPEQQEKKKDGQES